MTMRNLEINDGEIPASSFTKFFAETNRMTSGEKRMQCGTYMVIATYDSDIRRVIYTREPLYATDDIE